MTSQFHPHLVLLKAPAGSAESVCIGGISVEVDDGYVEAPRALADQLIPHGFTEVQARDAAPAKK